MPFTVSVLPSELSMKLWAKLVKIEDEYWIALEKISPSGTLSTEMDAGELAKVKVGVKYASAGSYGIKATKKLPFNRSIDFKDNVEIEGKILNAPVTPLASLRIPIGSILKN